LAKGNPPAFDAALLSVGWGANPNVAMIAWIGMLGFAPQPTSGEVFGKRLAQGFGQAIFFAHQRVRRSQLLRCAVSPIPDHPNRSARNAENAPRRFFMKMIGNGYEVAMVGISARRPGECRGDA
jgi:hypothetical protein